MKAFAIILIAVMGSLHLQGCKDQSSFSGSGDKKKKRPPEQNVPRNGGNSMGDPFLNTQPDACYENQELKKYNVIFVFDSSSSMKTVDPGFARAIGAELLVDRLAQLSSQMQHVQFQISMVRFATYAEQSRAGWIPVSPQTVPTLRQEIQAITANPLGGTSYVKALRATGNLFTKTNANSPDARNFVVFLTDGDPSDSHGEIQNEVQMLTRSFNAVIIAIATGQQLSPEGVGLVQSMAQPTTPLGSDPRHVGRFHQVASPDQLQGLFDQIYEKTFGCGGTQVTLK